MGPPATNGTLGSPAPAPTKDLPKLQRDIELKALEKSKVISGYLSLADREKLAGLLLVREYQKGQVIIQQGAPGDEFYILKKGAVEVWQETVVEQKKVNKRVNILNEGDCFGEQALISKVKRLASCIAASPVTVWVCSKEVFEKTFGVKRMFATRAAVSDNKAAGASHQASSNRDTKKPESVVQMILNTTEKNILFADLTREQKRGVVDIMWKVTAPKGVKLITQGAVNDDVFYVVESGSFEVSVGGERKGYRQAKECFGELALLYNQPRAATLTACEDSVLWAVDRFTFREEVAKSNKKTLDGYEQLLKKLDGVALLAGLSDEERRKVGEAIEEVQRPKGTILMSQGEKKPVDGTFYMYFLIEGKCYCEILNPDRSIKFKRDYKEGEYFGELALMNDEPRKATISCTTDCLLYALSADNFRELIGTVGSLTSNLDRERSIIYPNGRPDGKSIAEAAGTRAATVKQLTAYEKEAEGPPILWTDLNRNGKILGKGSFGTVKLVSLLKDKSKTFALKSVWKKQIVETGQQGHIMSEKKVMEHFRHPFLIRLHATYKDQHKLYFLLELSLGGELFTVLRARQAFDEPTARFYAATVVLAFDYMHSKDIIYRDLKPENLLLDSQGFLKVTDFGFAKEIPNGRTWTLCGTPDYLAPEIVAGKGHGKGVDWWTLGIFLFEMLASYPPFYDEDPMKTYSKIMAGKINYPAHFSKDATNLISRLLEHKPTKRLGVVKGGAENIKNHAFFKGFDWDKLYNRQLTPPIQQNVGGSEDTSNFDEYPPEDESDKSMHYTDDGTNWDKDF